MKNLQSILLGLALAAGDALYAAMTAPAFDPSDWKTWGRAVVVSALGYILAKLRQPAA